MPVFPGTEQPLFENWTALENNGFIESKITLYSHTGTHIDVPAHLLGDGLCLDDRHAEYFEDFPSLSEESAEWLSKFNLKGVGIDAISIDEMKSDSFKVHKIFLQKNTLVIENLWNLDSIREEYFILSILPLKNKKADGSPVRAVSIENMIPAL